MIKKVGLAAVVGVVALWVLGAVTFGMKRTNSMACSYFTKWQCNAIKQVPIEDEIDRVRNEVTQLVPDMNKHLNAIAEEKVQVEQLRNEVTTIRTALKGQKDNILTMTRDLESGAKELVYAGRSYPVSRVKEKLDNDFASYKRCEADLKSREQLLEAREKALNVALEQLSSMRDQKRELEVEVARLEAEVKTVRLEQSKSKFQLDDSRLANIKSTLNEIRGRVREEQVKADLVAQFSNDHIPVEKKAKSSTEVIKEVRQYFSDDTRDSKVVENK